MELSCQLAIKCQYLYLLAPQSVAVCWKVDHGRPMQSQVQPGTAGHSQVQPGTARYSQVQGYIFEKQALLWYQIWYWEASSGVLSGAWVGHHLEHVWGIIWGIIWGMPGASTVTCLGHHLGHVWGIIWGMSGACLGQHLGHVWGSISGMSGTYIQKAATFQLRKIGGKVRKSRRQNSAEKCINHTNAVNFVTK